MAKKQTTVPEGHAMTYLSIAREFHKAAEQLFDPQALLNKPVDFLYAHVMELAFKAFLRSHGELIIGTKLKTHQLTMLYGECKKHGLVIAPNDHTQIGNVVNWLDGANKYEGLRYFNPDLEGMPRTSFTREVIRDLMQVVGKAVEDYNQKHPVSTRSVRLMIVLGRPVDKNEAGGPPGG